MDTRLIRRGPRTEATTTLVCLSFCGGGTGAFRSWTDALPSGLDLAVMCYPGREGRFSEPLRTTWDELADDVIGALASLGDRPYVLFGHSMGGWLAFDVTARLEQRGGRGPRAVVVSASDAPSRYARNRDRPPTLADTDEQLVAWMRDVGQLDPAVLAEPDLLRMAVDLLRADMRVADTYRYVPGVTVRAPMHLFYGAEDEQDADAVTRRWRLLAAGGFTAATLPGGHFYLPEVWASLPAEIAARVTHLMDGVGTLA